MFSFHEKYILNTHIKVMKMLLQQFSLQVLKSVVNDDVLDGPHNLVKGRLHLVRHPRSKNIWQIFSSNWLLEWLSSPGRPRSLPPHLHLPRNGILPPSKQLVSHSLCSAINKEKKDQDTSSSIGVSLKGLILTFTTLTIHTNHVLGFTQIVIWESHDS